jgi:uncharacterized protein
MIVDCHATIWETSEQLGQMADTIRRVTGGQTGSAHPAAHTDAAACARYSLVMGLRSEFLQANVPNQFVADYVDANPQRIIGIAAIDPTAPDAADEAAACLDNDAFRGLVISPCDQNFHPADSRAMKLYELADQRKAVMIVRQGMYFHRSSPLQHARPLLLDEVAREFPKLTLVVTSIGYPWVDETLALLAKHERVFADTAGLAGQPWLAYTALATAYRYGVMDRILFASGFPAVTPVTAIETLYRLNEMTHGSNLPTVPREALRGVVERNALATLGIARAGEEPAPDNSLDERW